MAQIGTKEEKDGWSWPVGGLGEEAAMALETEVRALVTPYSNDPPPICYPGTNLDPRLIGTAAELLPKQLNLIGVHTTGKIGEGGFEAVQKIEAAAVRMIASVVGGKPKTVDGFFCGGATDANIQGIWVAREYMRQRPDPMGKGVVILATPLVHYSVLKAASLLDIGHAQKAHCPRCRQSHLFLPDRDGRGVNLVGMNVNGEMDKGDLERVFERKFSEGFRQFIIVPTVGTTAMGSVDPVADVCDFAKSIQRRGAQAYVHVDAAFGGFTVPFVSDTRIGFEYPEVMSMALDGDKMGRLPYPAGVFLCRKGLLSLVSMPVNYIRGNHDCTLPGSRSGLAPVLAYLLCRKEGRAGQARYVRHCIEARDGLAALLHERFAGTGVVNVLPHNQYVNQLAIEIRLNGDRPIPGSKLEGSVLAPYELRSDMFPREPLDVDSCPRTIYKLCVMPHVIPYIDRFVEDLATFVAGYRR